MTSAADIPELHMGHAGRYTQAAFATELQKLCGTPIADIPLTTLMRLLRSLSRRGIKATPPIELDDSVFINSRRGRFL